MGPRVGLNTVEEIKICACKVVLNNMYVFLKISEKIYWLYDCVGWNQKDVQFRLIYVSILYSFVY